VWPLTAPVAPLRSGWAAGAGRGPVRADPNLFVLGLLLVGCLLYASILVLDAVAESRDRRGEDASDAPPGG
jgi:hypothetical protein